MQSKWLWIMVCNAEQVVVSHGVIHEANGCESWCVILIQWLLIIVCIAEAVAVNHVILCCDGDCESWWVMLCQGVNHGVLSWESGFKSCCDMDVSHGV
jgi:hypothetical protein